MCAVVHSYFFSYMLTLAISPLQFNMALELKNRSKNWIVGQKENGVSILIDCSHMRTWRRLNLHVRGLGLFVPYHWLKYCIHTWFWDGLCLFISMSTCFFINYYTNFLQLLLKCLTQIFLASTNFNSSASSISKRYTN